MVMIPPRASAPVQFQYQVSENYISGNAGSSKPHSTGNVSVGDLTRIAPDGAKITPNIAKNQVTGAANANQAPSSSRIDFGPTLDVAQTILDVAGLVPGFGEAADLINAEIYTARGDDVNATLLLINAECDS